MYTNRRISLFYGYDSRVAAAAHIHQHICSSPHVVFRSRSRSSLSVVMLLFDYPNQHFLCLIHRFDLSHRHEWG